MILGKSKRQFHLKSILWQRHFMLNKPHFTHFEVGTMAWHVHICYWFSVTGYNKVLKCD